jgi:hypothetical protein
MKKYTLFLGLSILLFFASAFKPMQSNGRFVVLFVAVTEEPGIQASVNTSLQAAQQTYPQLATSMGLDYEEYVVKGHSVSPDNVKRKITEVLNSPRVSGKNILLVQTYSHGCNYQQKATDLPYLILNPTSNQIRSANERTIKSSHDIYDMMRRSTQFDHAHLWIEACNELLPGFSTQAQAFNTGTAFSGPNSKNSALFELFTSCESEVMSSSVYGQLSYGNIDGGFFSRHIFLGLKAVFEGKVKPQFDGPNGFHEHVINLTRAYAKQQKDNKGKYINQIPQGFVGVVQRTGQNAGGGIVGGPRPPQGGGSGSAPELIETPSQPELDGVFR